MRVLRVVVVLLVSTWRPAVAEACFCAPDCAAVATSGAIFEATVASIESGRRANADGSYAELAKTVRLKDVRAWRGEAPNLVMTGRDSCGYEFRVGTRYVIVASRDGQDGQFWPTSCSMTRPLADAGSFREYVDRLAEPANGTHVWGRVASASVVTLKSGPHTVATPIVGARVVLDGPTPVTLETDAEGRFSRRALPAGDYSVAVELPRGAEQLGAVSPRAIVLRDENPCVALELWTEASGVVEGTVVDDAGQPVAGYLVYLKPVGYSVYGPRVPNAAVAQGQSTDAAGRYRFTTVAPGRYEIGSSIMFGPTEQEPYALSYGRTASGDTEIVMDRAPVPVDPIVLRRLTPRRVTGRVLWADGQPVAGLTVGAAPVGERGPIRAVTSTTIGDAGGFKLPVFDGARYEFTITRARRVIHRSEIVVTNAPLVITVPVP